MELLVYVLAFAAVVSACQRRERDQVNELAGKRRRTLVRRQGQTTSPAQLDENESVLVNSFESTDLDSWSYYYTHGLHVAGTNQSMAQWTADRWAENGFTSGLATYYTYLNYPVSKSLTFTSSNGTVYTPSLAEDVLEQDETTSYPNRVPTYHGYSFSGSASGELVYVGRGQKADFDRLVALGVDLKGKIALARYGGPFRGLKVKNSQQYGMIGTLIYTDIADDGNITESKGYAAYPDGPARNPSSVQRGSVQFLSQYPGDPTTPGYPSKEDSPRAGTDSVTPRIPSIPLSWQDAQPLLRALDGQGPSGKQINRTSWIGALNVTYSAGPTSGAIINLTNTMRDTITPIWDAYGIINGTSQDEVLIVGNHRDAWPIGGAADPNSGSAVMIELSKAFGALLKTGWQPRRTIVLASWDAEEYGLLGSTEWVEEYAPWLVGAAVAYINLDTAVSGPIPGVSATPDLHNIAIQTMKKILYPSSSQSNLTNTTTMYDIWSSPSLGGGEIGVLGSGSDYTSFLHSNGISSIDLGSDAGPTSPVYHYHSNYDSYHWMTTFGDPGFQTHKAIGQYITLLTYHLANDEVLPLDPANYGVEMTGYLEELSDVLAAANVSAAEVDLADLEAAIAEFNASAAALTSNTTTISPTVLNAALKSYQRGFTNPSPSSSSPGLPRRPYFKHVVFAPGLDTGYAAVTWPGITEAITQYGRNVSEARSEVVRAAGAVRRAGEILRV
ncbi:MAG: hypothetical protein Q9160_007200 [Pyrenula sp. 1 TL-2023]